MKLTELIAHLQTLEAEHGDKKVCTTESHVYWGTLYRELEEFDISIGNAQPKGPKSGQSEECVVFENF